jgi:hypothetical protein
MNEVERRHMGALQKDDQPDVDDTFVVIASKRKSQAPVCGPEPGAIAAATALLDFPGIGASGKTVSRKGGRHD